MNEKFKLEDVKSKVAQFATLLQYESFVEMEGMYPDPQTQYPEVVQIPPIPHDVDVQPHGEGCCILSCSPLHVFFLIICCLYLYR